MSDTLGIHSGSAHRVDSVRVSCTGGAVVGPIDRDIYLYIAGMRTGQTANRWKFSSLLYVQNELKRIGKIVMDPNGRDSTDP